MKSNLTISISKLSSLFKILEQYRIDVKDFLKSEGIDPIIVESPDNRLPLEGVHRLYEKACSLTADEYLGLHQGEIFTGLSNILGYVLMNCRNLGEAIEKYVKYQRIADEGRRFEYHSSGSQAVLQFHIMDERFTNERHFIDNLMVGVLAHEKKLTGKELPLLAAHFSYSTPRDIAEYKRIFRCALKFNSKMNALVFDKKYLNLPVLQPNRELLEVFEKYANQLIKKMAIQDSYSDKVSRILAATIRGETPSIEFVARQLALSVRNLQSKLSDEGTTFRNLLQNVRKELAIEYLNDSAIPIYEITYLLGFSEPSVFHRSFKHWTNYTPGTYRKQALK